MTKNIAIFKKKKTLFDYAGVWADIPDEGWREFEQKIEEARKERNLKQFWIPSPISFR